MCIGECHLELRVWWGSDNILSLLEVGACAEQLKVLLPGSGVGGGGGGDVSRTERGGG